jgi:hypothetical protein
VFVGFCLRQPLIVLFAQTWEDAGYFYPALTHLWEIPTLGSIEIGPAGK